MSEDMIIPIKKSIPKTVILRRKYMYIGEACLLFQSSCCGGTSEELKSPQPNRAVPSHKAGSVGPLNGVSTPVLYLYPLIEV